MQRWSDRPSNKPERFQDMTFIPGSNNAYTAGRTIDRSTSLGVSEAEDAKNNDVTESECEMAESECEMSESECDESETEAESTYVTDSDDESDTMSTDGDE